MFQVIECPKPLISDRSKFHGAVANALGASSSPDQQIIALVAVMHDFVVPRRFCVNGCSHTKVDAEALVVLFETTRAIIEKHVAWPIKLDWLPAESVKRDVLGYILNRAQDYSTEEYNAEAKTYLLNQIRHNYPKFMHRMEDFAIEGMFAKLITNPDLSYAEIAACYRAAGAT